MYKIKVAQASRLELNVSKNVVVQKGYRLGET